MSITYNCAYIVWVCLNAMYYKLHDIVYDYNMPYNNVDIMSHGQGPWYPNVLHAGTFAPWHHGHSGFVQLNLVMRRIGIQQ